MQPLVRNCQGFAFKSRYPALAETGQVTAKANATVLSIRRLRFFMIRKANSILL